MSRATLGTLKAAIERGTLKAAPVSQLVDYCARNERMAIIRAVLKYSRASQCSRVTSMGMDPRNNALPASWAFLDRLVQS